ncbi:MAG: GNAT family N-acetyltransferase [Jatrophihabitans sp.]
MPSGPVVQVAAAAELDSVVLYRILALRSEVFVLEQDCVYLDQDGRDLELGAVQLWIEDGGAVVATLRLLSEPGDVTRVGRVATASAARGRGLAGLLMRRAIELSGDRAIVLDAQSPLAGWYGGFGFGVDGPEFIEDGIPHVPMRRVSSGAPSPADTFHG